MGWHVGSRWKNSRRTWRASVINTRPLPLVRVSQGSRSKETRQRLPIVPRNLLHHRDRCVFGHNSSTGRRLFPRGRKKRHGWTLSATHVERGKAERNTKDPRALLHRCETRAMGVCVNLCRQGSALFSRLNEISLRPTCECFAISGNIGSRDEKKTGWTR